MKNILVIFILFSISLRLCALPQKDNSRDSLFLKESISYILANTSQEHPEKFDTLCSIILAQNEKIKSIFGRSSSEYNTLIQTADFIYTLRHIPGYKTLQNEKELGKWIRKTERDYKKAICCKLSIATALSDYYYINNNKKKAKYWIDIQKTLSKQSNNYIQLENAYITEIMVATIHRDTILLHNVINDILNEKRITQHAVVIALNHCLLFCYNYLKEKELETVYNAIAEKDSLSLQELLTAADKAAEHNDTTGVNIILGSRSVQSLTPDEYIHLFHEVSSFLRESNPNKAIELLNIAIRYGKSHNRNDLLFEEWDNTYHYYRTIALHYNNQLNDRKSYIEYELKNLKEIELYYGIKSLEYCKTTTDIANIMSIYGHSAELTMLYDSMSVKSHLDLYGCNSSEYIQSVLNQMGHAKVYHKYDHFWKSANRIENVINNSNDSIQAKYFNLLGQVCSMQGDDKRAVLMYYKALKKTNTYQEKCFVLLNLATHYQKEGNDEVFQKELKGLIEHSGFKELPGYIKFILLDGYADYISDPRKRYGFYKKAEGNINDSGIPIRNRVLHYLNKSRCSATRIEKLDALTEAKKQCFQEEPRDTAIYVQVLVELGEEYNSFCNVNNAIVCYEEIFDIIKSRELFQVDYQECFTEYILSELTKLYMASGDVVNSQKYAELWLDFIIKICNRKHDLCSSCLLDVSRYLPIAKTEMLYEKYDDVMRESPNYLWGKAYLFERKGLFKEAIFSFEKCLQDSILITSTLPHLLKLYNKMGYNNKISEIEDTYVNSQNNFLLSQLVDLTESEQKKMLRLIEGSVVQVLQGIPNFYSSHSLFSHILFHKGLLYNISSYKRGLFSRKRNRALRENLMLFQEEIAKTKIKRDSLILCSLQVKKDSLERLLLVSNNIERIVKSDLYKKSSSMELQKVLKDDELIIDFEKFNDGDDIYYKAVVMARDIPPTFINLYKEKNDTVFYSNLEPYIASYRKVYFLPSGASFVYPLECFLREKYKFIEFHRLFSLLDIHADRSLKDFNVLAFGSPNFNSESSQNRNQRGNIWQPLPGSKVEIDSITSYVEKYTTGRVLRYIGNQATEGQFKFIDKKDVSILHISTHGYYDSLTNESGLLFTGVNRSMAGENNDNTDDGILTCEEIENLYFPNLKLVVLSACETGLGESNIDGVWGLQRAFRIAGAQNMIVSLKKVDDDLTQAFMINFYKNLTSGKSIYNSFWEAMDNADEDTRNSFILIE